MTHKGFFDWAQAQDIRYEFDGFDPVAMTDGTANHTQITQNILVALRTRLRGSDCRPLGPDAGVATVGGAIRYPDGSSPVPKSAAMPKPYRASLSSSKC